MFVVHSLVKSTDTAGGMYEHMDGSTHAARRRSLWVPAGRLNIIVDFLELLAEWGYSL